MKASTYLFTGGKFERSCSTDNPDNKIYHIVFGFGKKELICNPVIYNLLRSEFPGAELVLCSTAGEIYGSEVFDDSIVLTGILFEKTKLNCSSVNVSDYSSSFEAGVALIKSIEPRGLRNLLLISDGSMVNGSELVNGIKNTIQPEVPVTGGLAGDSSNFESTAVGLNILPSAGNIIGIGFYGDKFRISHGSMGGWEVFGLEKTITSSESNIVFEIDDSNALDLYKNYLGKYANDLPGSALLFPLNVQLPGSNENVVRTILSINNSNKSMVFAGDVPVGSKVRFMRANFDNLIDAASIAAQKSLTSFNSTPKLALLISCVGRKIILGKRVDEEVEAVAGILGKDTLISGFYSYGEISPLHLNGSCQLHNQTMTITTFDEVD